MSVFTTLSMPADKANHVVGGAVITAVSTLAIEALARRNGWGMCVVPAETWALGVCVLSGGLKEAGDYYINYLAKKKGLPPEATVEWYDALATAFGGFVVWVSQLAHVSCST